MFDNGLHYLRKNNRIKLHRSPLALMEFSHYDLKRKRPSDVFLLQYVIQKPFSML